MFKAAWEKTREPGNPIPSQLGTSRKDFGISRKDFGKSFREISKSFREVPSWLEVGLPGSRVFSQPEYTYGIPKEKLGS